MKGSRIFVLIAVILLGWWGYSEFSEKKADARRNEKRIQFKKKMAEFAGRYNAVTDWREKLGKKRDYSDVFSIELENALTNTGGRPILVTGELKDIAKRGEHIFIHVRDWFSLNPDIYFILECNDEQAKRVLSHKRNLFAKHAFITSVSSVAKPEFAIKATPYTEETAGLEVDVADVFVARGRCLDLLLSEEE